MKLIILIAVLLLALPAALGHEIVRRVLFVLSVGIFALLSIHVLVVACIFTYSRFHP